MSVNCERCGFSNSPGIARCQKCGAGLPVSEAQAPAAPSTPQAAPVFQVNVNAPQASSVVQSASNSKLAAGLLCFFLGYLGVHRFYLGYTIIGLIQFFTLGGFVIWALIDLIMIITGSLNDADGRPLT